MSRTMKNLTQQAQQANGMTVLQANSKIRNEKFTSLEILIKKFKMGICCRGPNRVAVLQTKKVKELKHLGMTSRSPKILKDFLSRPIVCASNTEME